MSDKPLVSVLMTAYNREKYIGEAIESVLASSYINFELIVVDDCSGDNTLAIVNGYACKDERIRVYGNLFNLGQFSNRNKAASFAKGEYIKYLDSDDTITIDGLADIMSVMLSNPVAKFGSRSRDNIIQVYHPRESYVNHFFKGVDFLYVGPSGTIFKKDFFEKMGGFEEGDGILLDTLLMLKMAAVAPFVSLPAGFLFWRIHDDRVTMLQEDDFKMVIERAYINKKILNFKYCPFNEKEKNIVRQNSKSIFIRKCFKHLTKLKSVKKYRQLLKEQGIKLVDFGTALFPNKRIEV